MILMKVSDLLAMAGRNLLRRKSRTILTILSVVIGSISIILMLSLGFGFSRQMEENMRNIGSLTVLQVNPSQYVDPYDPNAKEPTSGVITDAVVKKIQEIPHVERVLPTANVQTNLQFRRKGYEIWSNVRAIDFSALKEGDVELAEGRLPENKPNFEMIFGSEMRVFKVSPNGRGGMTGRPAPADDFDLKKERSFLRAGYKDESLMPSGVGGRTYEDFPTSVVGRIAQSDLLDSYSIYISMESYRKFQEVTMELEEKQMGGSPEDGAAQPMRPRKKQKTTYYEELRVKIDRMENVEEVGKKLEEDFRLNPYSEAQWIEEMKKQAQQVQLLLGGIGSVALLVASIGISNTMLMSIYERTREIGVMKVIGAQVKDVRRLFLVEAMLIGVIGGMIGVAASYGLSHLINSLVAQSNQGFGGDVETQLSYIPVWLPLAAMAFSAVVGLAAGYFPARRATRLSAIEAIRTN